MATGADKATLTRDDLRGMLPVPPLSADLELITEQVLASAVARVDLTAIPQTYRHLLLVVHARGDDAGAASRNLLLLINSTSTGTTNYDFKRITNGTVSEGASGGFIRIGGVPTAAATANRWGIARVLFPNYAAGARQPTCLSEFGAQEPLTIGQAFGTRKDSAQAIFSLHVYAEAGNLIAGTMVGLYGIKGA